MIIVLHLNFSIRMLYIAALIKIKSDKSPSIILSSSFLQAIRPAVLLLLLLQQQQSAKRIVYYHINPWALQLQFSKEDFH